MSGRHGGLTALEWTGVGADVALVALLIAVAVGFGGDGRQVSPAPAAAVVASPNSPSPGGASTRAAAGPSPSASAAAASFQLPSGNISCTVSDEGATCTIASFTYSPPAVAGCTGQTGHLVVLSDEGVQTPCVEGATPQVTGTLEQLAYGSSVTRGDYCCTSGTDGATCVQVSTGTGFRLASRALTLLPG